MQIKEVCPNLWQQFPCMFDCHPDGLQDEADRSVIQEEGEVEPTESRPRTHIHIKVCSYIAQYPVRSTAQNTLRFTPW